MWLISGGWSGNREGVKRFWGFGPWREGSYPPNPYLVWTKNVIVFITKSIFLVHLRNFFQKSIFFKLLYDRFVCFFPFKRLNLGFLLTLNSQGKTLQSSKRKQKNCLAESFICEYFWHIAKEWTRDGINRILNLKSNTENCRQKGFWTTKNNFTFADVECLVCSS